MLKEFKEFVARANVLDLAVAVIIGAAFGKIITTLVEGVIMPPLGMLIGKVAIRRVEKDRCVADIVPGWNLGEIREGDKFIAAHVSEDL